MNKLLNCAFMVCLLFPEPPGSLIADELSWKTAQGTSLCCFDSVFVSGPFLVRAEDSLSLFPCVFWSVIFITYGKSTSIRSKIFSKILVSPTTGRTTFLFRGQLCSGTVCSCFLASWMFCSVSFSWFGCKRKQWLGADRL